LTDFYHPLPQKVVKGTLASASTGVIISPRDAKSILYLLLQLSSHLPGGTLAKAGRFVCRIPTSSSRYDLRLIIPLTKGEIVITDMSELPRYVGRMFSWLNAQTAFFSFAAKYFSIFHDWGIVFFLPCVILPPSFLATFVFLATAVEPDAMMDVVSRVELAAVKASLLLPDWRSGYYRISSRVFLLCRRVDFCAAGFVFAEEIYSCIG